MGFLIEFGGRAGPRNLVVCVKLCKKVVWYLVDPYALSVTRRA